MCRAVLIIGLEIDPVLPQTVVFVMLLISNSAGY